MNQPLHHRLLPTWAALTLVCAGAFSAAEAATVYRCGPSGTAFSDTPCQNARVLEVDDRRTEAQRLDGLRVAGLERRLATDLERERLQREAASKPLAAGFVKSAPVAADAPRLKAHRSKLHRTGQPSKAQDFTVILPQPAKPRRR